jgi:hypothetical protein
MTADEFRNIACSLPEAVEQSHMDHPDFRVGGKIFATLGYPSADFGMIKLAPRQQQELVVKHPDIFTPVKGGWGRAGATNVHLGSATEEILRRAMIVAWRNAAPKGLADAVDDEEAES